MHGPASYSGGSYKAPTWPRLPAIDVLDTIAPALGPAHLALWRIYRSNALGRWARSGLRFPVKEDDPARYPTFDLSIPDETARLQHPMVDGFLRLVRMPKLYGGSVEAVGTWLPATDPGAIVGIKLGLKFWSATIARRNYILTHEIGHCLGLNHNIGGRSVMGVTVSGYATGSVPDAHDLDSLRAYYHL